MASQIDNINLIYKNMNKCICKYPHIKDDIIQTTSDDISRFLSKHQTPENAYKKIIEYLLWRSNNNILALKHSDFPPDIRGLVVIQNKNEYLYVTISVKGFVKYDDNRKICIKYLVHMCETLPKNGKIILIIDMSDLKITDIDLKMMQEILHITENYYPNLTYKVIFKNLPQSLNTIMNTLIGFMSESTRNKITFA